MKRIDDASYGGVKTNMIKNLWSPSSVVKWKQKNIFQVDMYEISMTKNLIGITGGRQRFMSKYEIKYHDTL